MRKYEGLFIFPPEGTSGSLKDQKRRLEEALRRFGGRIVQQNEWGRRPLGYALKKFREGEVVLWHFEIDPAQLAEFRKALALEETLLKSTIVKLEGSALPHPEPRRESERREPGRPEGVEKKETEVPRGRKP